MSEKNVIQKSSLSPTVLIVGGAGFIGSHLSERLLLKNARVIVIDNFSTGKDIFVHSLLKNPKFALFDVDINQGVSENIKSVDYVIHLAGLETYMFDKGDINLDSLLTNAVGTKNVLDFSHKVGAKFLLVSTVDVYKGLISPLTLDNYFGQTPQEEKMYSLAEAKRYAEALVWEYYKREKTNVRIARVPEVYGPRMSLDASGNLGRLLRSMIENRDLIVFGEGIEKEFYLYIEDVVSGLVKALFTDNTEGKIYTFLPKESHTVLETTYLVKSLANRDVRVVFKQKTDKFVARDLPSIDTSNMKELDWSEKKSFKDGIISTLKWLGYEPNEHSFKTNKLIEDKKRENMQKGSEVSSITSDNESVSVNTNNMLKNKPQKKFSLKKLFLKTFSFIKTTFSKRSSTQRFIITFSKAKTFFAYLFILFLFLVIFIGVPVLQTYVHTKIGVRKLYDTQEGLMFFDIDEAKKLSNDSFGEFYKAQKSLSRIKWLFIVTGQKDVFNDSQHVFDFAKNASKSMYYLSKGSAPLVNLWEGINPNSTTTLNVSEFDESYKNFTIVKESLGLAQASLNEVHTDIVKSKVSSFSKVIATALDEIDFLLAFSSDTERLLGFDAKKNYLILFQNSNELRATGGFIGSYAVLTLKNGKIETLSIDDVYNPDGQIDLRKIEITPPKPITTYLEEDVLHIRNANWNPDFPQSASQIEDLFYRIDGRKFDGVVAVDLRFVENLLKVTGPVFLATYNEEVNSQNLYERAQFHSEFNYKEGSEQKRTFLTVLGGKILESLFSLDQSKLVLLGTKVQEAFNEKHLLVDIKKNALQDVLSKKGWNGALVETAGDYLFVVNSNVGGTKANYYVKNGIDYNVFSATRDGLLRAKLTLNYDHTGTDTVWPGGPYTNYLRVLTPVGSKLTGATVLFSDGTEENVFDLVTTSTFDTKTQFALGFVLEPQNRAQVLLSYDLPKELAITKETDSYSLYIQKQPGTQNDSLNFKFNAPFGVHILKTVPETEVGASSFQYSSILNSDLVFDVTFD